jgi:hypothetical protein
MSLNPSQLVELAQQKGICLSVVGNKLSCKFDGSASQETLELIRANKPSLMQYLAEQEQIAVEYNPPLWIEKKASPLLFCLLAT